MALKIDPATGLPMAPAPLEDMESAGAKFRALARFTTPLAQHTEDLQKQKDTPDSMGLAVGPNNGPAVYGTMGDTSSFGRKYIGDDDNAPAPAPAAPSMFSNLMAAMSPKSAQAAEPAPESPSGAADNISDPMIKDSIMKYAHEQALKSIPDQNDPDFQMVKNRLIEQQVKSLGPKKY